MLNRSLVGFFQSKRFKKIAFFLGVIFLIITAFTAVKPEPFLKFGYAGIFISNLFGAGTFLIIPLAKHFNIFTLALVLAFGIALNDSVSWFIGNSGTAIIPKGKKLRRIEGTIQKYGMVALFFWSLIPFPYDLIGFVAGYLGLKYPKFIIPTFLGKFIRLLLLGAGVIKLL